MIECPYCHFKQEDVWEFSKSQTIVRCLNCDNDFFLQRNISYDAKPAMFHMRPIGLPQ